MAHSTTNAPDLSESSLTGSGIGSLSRIFGIAAVVLLGTALWLGYRGGDPAFFAKSYLLGFMFVLAICLGALFFVTVQHLTRAGWSVVVRRPAEALMQNLRWLWILFLPVGWMAWTHQLDVLYPWANLEHLATVAPAEAELVSHKSAFLNERFFFIRAGIYFLVWAGLAWFFWSRSTRQDSIGGLALTESCRRVSAPGMLLFGLTATFAAIDWMMSLAPAWFSTMYGVYFFCDCATCGLSVITLCCLVLQRKGYLRGVITAEHYQDLGKLLFAFGMVFWAYIAFSQFMLIWYGNIPEETAWFLPRQVGGWLQLSWALLLGHFILPFLFLISRWPKRFPGSLAFACVWMLLFGFVDLFYLIMPTIPHDLASFNSQAEFAEKYAGDPTRFADPLVWSMALGMLFLLLAMTGRALKGHTLLAKGDPSLRESLSFQNM